MSKSSDTAKRSARDIQDSFNNMNFSEARGGLMLVDDLVDSRWTVTVAGRALRLAGAGAVLPLVLGQAG